MTYRLICTTPTAELAWAFGAANEATTAMPDLVPGPRGLTRLIRSDRSGLRSAPVFRRVLAAASYGVLLPRPPWDAEQPHRVRREQESRDAHADALLTTWWEQFRRGRCIVPVAGFFDRFALEPSAPEQRHAHAIRAADGETMALAGLFDDFSWDRIGGFAIITVACDDPDAAPTGRMPAILHGEAEIAAWLGETQAMDDELLALLRPTPASALDRWRVGEAANEACNKGPEVLERPATG